ncbi:MAG: branched-chain amino acid ABC transporter substrate-binding protein [Rhodospirillaceae bacterium]|nr:branched-chain amino acid ABC transporter substrate-binding protein [Rhodospirillaceae bacterium]
MTSLKSMLVAAVALSAFGAASAHAQIVIGTAGPMTGQYASFGEQMANGAEMAVADINAAGGVLGEQLELFVGDDACDPRQAVSVANDAVADGVVFMAGHFCSGSSIPASQVYTEEGVLQISPASTNPALTDDGGPNVFRVCGRDDQQGIIAAQYLAENFPDANIAIVHDRTAYGKGLADATLAALHDLGVTETLYEAYTPGESDYSALITRLNAENIDVLYVGGYHTEAGLMVRQMREQGMDTQLVSGDALVTDEYWAITGDAGEGTLMTFGPDPRNFETAADVVDRFRAEGIEPEGYTLYTYAAIQVFAAAAEEAGSTDLDALISIIQGGTFDTVIGTLTFDDNGDIEQPAYVWYQWHDGTYGEIEVASAPEMSREEILQMLDDLQQQLDTLREAVQSL